MLTSNYFTRIKVAWANKQSSNNVVYIIINVKQTAINEKLDKCYWIKNENLEGIKFNMIIINRNVWIICRALYSLRFPGLGFGLSYTVTVVAVCDYFQRLRPLALGLSSMGVATGNMISPGSTQHWSENSDGGVTITIDWLFCMNVIYSSDLDSHVFTHLLICSFVHISWTI